VISAVLLPGQLLYGFAKVIVLSYRDVTRVYQQANVVISVCLLTDVAIFYVGISLLQSVCLYLSVWSR